MFRELYRRALRSEAALLLAAATTLFAPCGRANEAADAILGDWRVASGDALVRIERHGDEYQGRLVWLLHDRYGPEDGRALAGKPVTDRNNPDPTLRNRPLLGLRLLWNLRYDGKGKWSGGWIYNSNDGRRYRCEAQLEDADHLRVRGYLGIPLLGGSTVWTRVPRPPPAD